MNDSSSGPDLLNDLAHEFAKRYRQGEGPSPTEYAERHPELADQIRELFPTLAVMEEFGSVPVEDPERAANSKRAPERLGEYRVLREVGRGGMGVVYEAVQESLGRHVALKVLPIRGSAPQKQRERFKREAIAAATLHHTNIVPVFGVGEVEGVHFYAMQFIHGLGLDVVLEEVRRLRAGVPTDTRPGPNANMTASLAAGLVSGFELVRQSAPTDPAILTRNTHTGSTSAVVGKSGESATGSDYYRRVALIGLQVAEALAHAHAQGVLHRDVKPSNLLLDARGCVWVTDFGLAKLEGGEELTNPGDIVGTLRYMPPERFAGKEDARGDVYGLGLTLYEMLALRPAFDAPDRPRLLELVRRGDVPNPRQSDPRVPRDLETVVLKAAARDPRDRYQTAADLAADLGRFLADRPVHARRVSWVEQGRRWCRRNRAITALTAGVLLSLTLAVVVLAVGNVRIREQKNETDKALGERNDALQTAGVNLTEAHTQATLAKQNEKFASEQKLLAARRFHNAQIYLANLAVEAGDIARSLALLETLRPKFDEDDLRTFEWYYLWQLCNRNLRFICRGHEATVASVQVSPDGKTIVSGSADGSVRLWNLATGKRSVNFRGAPEAHSQVAFSPDGRLLANGRFDRRLGLQVWNTDTGRELTFTQHSSAARSVTFSPDGATLVCGFEDGSVRFWNTVTGQERTGSPVKHNTAVVSLAFSPDGKTLATASAWGDKLTKLWDLSVSPIRQRLELPGSHAVAFSPDNTRLVTGAHGAGANILWDVATGKKLTEFGAHRAVFVMSLTYSPDGKYVIWGGEDRVVRVREMSSGEERILGAHSSTVCSVAVSADSKTVVSGGADGAVKVWNLTAPAGTLILPGSGGWTNFVEFTRDGNTFVSQSGPVVKIWDVAGGQLGSTIPMECRHGAISPDGRTLALMAGDATLKLWDVVTGQELASAKPNPGTVEWLGLVWSPDGKTLASYSNNAPGVKLWDVTGGLKQHTLLPVRWVCCVAFSPDGKSLAVGTQFSDLYVFDAATREKKLHNPESESNGGNVWAVRFSPDGKTLASLFGSGTVKLWERDTLLLRVSIQAHTQKATGLTFSPDGKSLATASHDGTVKLWDTLTGQERLSYKPPISAKSPAVPLSVAFSPDGNTLAIGCGEVFMLGAATSEEARGRKIAIDFDDPDSPLLLNIRGDHLWKSGSVAGAEATYRRAMALLERATREYPDLERARDELVRSAYTLCALLASVGRPDDAASFRRQAEELFRQRPPEARAAAIEKLFDWGETLRLAGQAPAARHVYALVTVIESDSARSWSVRSRAFLALGEYEKAVAEWAPLRKDPTVAPHLLPFLCLARYRAGDYRGALDTANDANRRGIGTVPCCPLLLALAHEKLGERDVARKWYLIGLVHLHRTAAHDPELLGLRAEASKLLGLPEELTPEEQQLAADTGRFLTLIPQADPKAAWVLRQRGLSTVDKNTWEQAIIDHSKAIALDPNNSYPWHRRAEAYRQLKNWNLALADFDRACELDPNDGGIWNQRGHVQSEGFGDLEAAIRDYTRAIELSPLGVSACWYNRGIARTRLSRWEEAVADFDEAIKLNPNFVHSWLERGNCNFQLGRYDRAVVDFTGAIRLEPKDSTLWQSRGAAHSLLGEYDKAATDMTKAIELAPRNPSLLIDRANNYARLGKRNEALADLDKTAEVAPNYAATVHQQRAIFLNDLFGPEHRDPKGAMEAAQKALAIAPKDGISWSALGRAHYLAGDYKSALESFTKATELRTDKGPHLVFRAMTHWKLGQKDKARRWYSEWAGNLEQTRTTWETNRPMAEISNRYRTEALALWGAALPDVAPLPRAVPSPKK